MRASRIQRLENAPPSASRRGEFQDVSNPAVLRAVKHKEIHPCGMHRILRAFQQARFKERFERLRDFFNVVSHKRRKLFARQERARMSVQEHEQIKVAGAAHYRRPSEDTYHVFRVAV